MTYQRLETSTINSRADGALRSEAADPLWFLGRQWQVGELQGEDGGRPVALRVSSRRVRPQFIRGGPVAKPRGQNRDLVDGPLEPQVEGEARLDGPGATMWSARLGAQLLRMLAEVGLSASAIDRLRKEHILKPTADMRPIDQALCRRGTDGFAIASAHRKGTLDLPAKVHSTMERWLADVEAQRTVDRSGERLRTWDAERQEYQFHLKTEATRRPSLTLNAPEYLGRRADWFNFDVIRRPTFDALLDDQKPTVDEVLASPIRFRGTPASRWWAIEDEEVSLGHLRGSDTDLARAVVAGFVTTFGSDWLMAPLSAELGDLVEVSSIVVIDSFGDPTPVPAMAGRDAVEVEAGNRPWKFFELSGDSGPASGRAPLLYLTPTAGDVGAGPVLERILLAHDELSNLGWAIEEIVESSFARPADRANNRAADLEHEPDDVDDHAGMQYRLDPEIPEHWLPLVPVQRRGSDHRWRQRGRITRPVDAPADWGTAQGLLLEPTTRLLLHEEEIPRSGAAVTRRVRATRDANGRLLVWVGRRKRLGNVKPAGAFIPDRVIGEPRTDEGR